MVLRNACRLNGLTGIAVTKLDVLQGLKEVKACVAYRLDGKIIDRIPSRADDFARCEPIYEAMSGWPEDARGARTWNDLPRNARHFLDFVAKESGCPIVLVSVGPGREETVEVSDPFRS